MILPDLLRALKALLAARAIGSMCEQWGVWLHVDMEGAIGYRLSAIDDGLRELPGSVGRIAET